MSCEYTIQSGFPKLGSICVYDVALYRGLCFPKLGSNMSCEYTIQSGFPKLSASQLWEAILTPLSGNQVGKQTPLLSLGINTRLLVVHRFSIYPITLHPLTIYHSLTIKRALGINHAQHSRYSLQYTPTRPQ